MSSKRKKMPSQTQPLLPQPGRRSLGPFPSTAQKAIDDPIICDTDDDVVLDSQSFRKPQRQRRYNFNEAVVASIRSTPDVSAPLSSNNAMELYKHQDTEETTQGEMAGIKSDHLLDEKLPAISRSSRLWLPSIKDNGMSQSKSRLGVNNRPGLLFKPSRNTKTTPEQPSRYAPDHDTRLVAPNCDETGRSPSSRSSRQVKSERDTVSSGSGSNDKVPVSRSTVTSLAPQTGLRDPYDFPDSEDENIQIRQPARNAMLAPRTSLPKHVGPRKPTQSSTTPPATELPRPRFATYPQHLRPSHSSPTKMNADICILSDSISDITSIPQTPTRIRHPGLASSSQHASDTVFWRPAGTSRQQPLRSPKNKVTEVADTDSPVRPSATAMGKRAHHSINDNILTLESGSRTTKKVSPRPLMIKNSRGTFSVRRRANSAPSDEQDHVVSHHVRRKEDSQQHEEETHIIESPELEGDVGEYQSHSSRVSPKHRPTLLSQIAKTRSSPLRRPQQSHHSHRSEGSLEIPQPRSLPNHARSFREAKTPRHTQSSPSSRNRSKLRTYGQKTPANTAAEKEPATIQDLKKSYDRLKQSRALATRRSLDLIASSQSVRPKGRPRKINSDVADSSLCSSPSAATRRVKSMMTTRAKKAEVQSQPPQGYYLSGSELSDDEYQPSEQSTCSFNYGKEDVAPRNIRNNGQPWRQNSTSARPISSQPEGQPRSKSRSRSGTPFVPVNRLSRKPSSSSSAPRDSSSRLSGGYSKRVRDVFSDASDDPAYGDDDDRILRMPPTSLADPFKLDRTKKPNTANDTDAVNNPKTLDDLYDIAQDSSSHELHELSDNLVERKPWWQPWDWARKYGGIEFETQGSTVWFSNGPFRGYITSGPLEGNYMPGTEAPDDRTLALAEEIAAQAVEESDWPTSAEPSIRSTSRASDRVVEYFEADEDSAHHRATDDFPDLEAGEASRKAEDVKDSDSEERASLQASLPSPLSGRTKATSPPPVLRATPREVRMEMTKQYVLTGRPTTRIPPWHMQSHSRNVEEVPESVCSDGQDQAPTQAKRPHSSRSMKSVPTPALTSRTWASSPPSNQELGALMSSSPFVHSALPPSSPIRHMKNVPFGPRRVPSNIDDDDDGMGSRSDSEPSEIAICLLPATPSPRTTSNTGALRRFETSKASALNLRSANIEGKITRQMRPKRQSNLDDDDDDDKISSHCHSKRRSEITVFLPPITRSPKPPDNQEFLQRFEALESSAFNVQNVDAERRVTRSMTKSSPAVQKPTMTKHFALDAKSHGPDDGSDAASLDIPPALQTPSKRSSGRPQNAQKQSQCGSTQLVRPMTGFEPRTTIIVEVPGLTVEERAQYAACPPWYSAKVNRSRKSTGTVSDDLGDDLKSIHADTGTELHSHRPFSSRGVVDGQDVIVDSLDESFERSNSLSQVKSPSRATIVPKISVTASRGERTERTEKTPKIKERSTLAESDSEYSDSVAIPVNDKPVDQSCPVQACSDKNLVHHRPSRKPSLHKVAPSPQEAFEVVSGSDDDVSPSVSLAIQRLNNSILRKPSPKGRKVSEEKTIKEQGDAAFAGPISIPAQIPSSKCNHPQGSIDNVFDVQVASSLQAAEDSDGSGSGRQGNKDPRVRKSRIFESPKDQKPRPSSSESFNFPGAKEHPGVEARLPFGQQNATVPLPSFYASYLRSQPGQVLSTTPTAKLEAEPSVTSFVRSTTESGLPCNSKRELIEVLGENQTLEPFNTSTPRSHPILDQGGSRVPRSNEKQERLHNKKIKKRKRKSGKGKGKPLASFATELGGFLKVTLDTDLLVKKLDRKRRKSETIGEAEDQAETDEADGEDGGVLAEELRRYDKADDRIADGPRYEARNPKPRKRKKRRRHSCGDASRGADETEAYTKPRPRGLDMDSVGFFKADNFSHPDGSGATMGVMTPPTTSRPSSPDSLVNSTLW